MNFIQKHWGNFWSLLNPALKILFSLSFFSITNMLVLSFIINITVKTDIMMCFWWVLILVIITAGNNGVWVCVRGGGGGIVGKSLYCSFILMHAYLRLWKPCLGQMYAILFLWFSRLWSVFLLDINFLTSRLSVSKFPTFKRQLANSSCSAPPWSIAHSELCI